MLNFLIAMSVVPLLLIGWLVVQSLARQFAGRHPEFGPPREEGTGCGGGCHCAGGHCSRKPTRD